MVTETEAPGVAVPKSNERFNNGLPLIVKLARPGASAENVSVAPNAVPGSVPNPVSASKAARYPGALATSRFPEIHPGGRGFGDVASQVTGPVYATKEVAVKRTSS